MPLKPATGQCLCGSVRFELPPGCCDVVYCHCKMCRRWNGGLPLAAVSGRVTLLAADALRWWRGAKWAERGFCKNCESSLFWRDTMSGEAWDIAASALDDESNLRTAGHIFIDDKADFYDFADTTPRETGAAHIAQFLCRTNPANDENETAKALAKYRAHSGCAFADEVKRLLQQNK